MGPTNARIDGTSPDGLAARIRTAILNGDLPPGTLLIQTDLAIRFGVSRIPLREALRTLAAEGMVTAQPGGSTLVTQLSPGDIDELYGIRLSLEPQLASSIVENSSLRAIGEMEELVAKMEAALDTNDAETYLATNYAFHVRMYDLAAAPHRVRLISQVLNLIEPYSRVYHYLLGGDRRRSDHRHMVELIRSGLSRPLADLIASHIEGGQDYLRRFIDGDLRPPTGD
jgi:DNA-binding GntR family transcriptional regulator